MMAVKMDTLLEEGGVADMVVNIDPVLEEEEVAEHNGS